MGMVRSLVIGLLGFGVGSCVTTIVESQGTLGGPDSVSACYVILRGDGKDIYNLNAFCQGVAIGLAQQELRDHPEYK